MKEIVFLGDSLEAISKFAFEAKRVMGFQLRKVQKGEDPDDWKPMKAVGAGVREIRVRDAAGIYRTLYVTSLGDAVIVLHAFVKKTQKTAPADIHLAKARLRDYRKMLK